MNSGLDILDNEVRSERSFLENLVTNCTIEQDDETNSSESNDSSKDFDATFIFQPVS